MKSPVIIFCGKGGVGKTTLSLAYGLLHARRGKRVLVVTSHPLKELAVSISLDGLPEEEPQAAANFFVVHIDPKNVLAATVKQHIPSLLAGRVLANRIYKSLIEIVPGLKEMAFLSRLQELAEHRVEDEAERRYELLIWDAPATGHFIDTIKASKNFDTYLTGPFAAKGRDLTHFFSERANIVLLPVTTLERMAVEETIELCSKLRYLGMHPEAIVCNLVSPVVSLSQEDFEAFESRMTSYPSREKLEFVMDRYRTERERFEALSAGVRVKKFPLVQRLMEWRSDLDQLEKIRQQLEAALAGVNPGVHP